jgi:hypothetical protein
MEACCGWRAVVPHQPGGADARTFEGIPRARLAAGKEGGFGSPLVGPGSRAVRAQIAPPRSNHRLGGRVSSWRVGRRWATNAVGERGSAARPSPVTSVRGAPCRFVLISGKLPPEKDGILPRLPPKPRPIGHSSGQPCTKPPHSANARNSGHRQPGASGPIASVRRSHVSVRPFARPGATLRLRPSAKSATWLVFVGSRHAGQATRVTLKHRCWAQPRRTGPAPPARISDPSEF